ncbi:TPA: hypothetical protein ACQVKY_005269, partial [Serratia marcescens]|uniref:Uncharacterized protein n=1 Tax=Serratia nevei TaxID=2703794 RepID=A0ABT7G5J9_9GAMM|nr:hypothetical protein [Serratia nevei]HAU4290854.1 hypothetical protein [Serratia marcescens]MDK5169024.1 hypothetical protein [Serratia nevei]MDK5298518.1 hypothetical protein [Serratia nevei]MEC5887230.1 hypothetical protein [Serratia nevei]HAU4297492.1 hypothetical protein [Serratia marcescens]
MDTKIVKKHSITLKEIKKAAVIVVGQANQILHQVKLEKDMHNGVALHRFKLTVTVYAKNRTANIKYEFYASNKKTLVMNMLNLTHPDELEHCFEPVSTI